MPNDVSSIFAFLNQLDNPEYNNLSKEEKANLDFMNSCLYSTNPRIIDAASNIMMLLVEISLDDNKYAPEDIEDQKEKIFKNLSEEETKIMNKFMLSCINSMGIYSIESIKQRKLKKEKGMI